MLAKKMNEINGTDRTKCIKTKCFEWLFPFPLMHFFFFICRINAQHVIHKQSMLFHRGPLDGWTLSGYNVLIRDDYIRLLWMVLFCCIKIKIRRC